MDALSMLRCLVAPSLLAVGACIELPEQSLIDDTRILGIRAANADELATDTRPLRAEFLPGNDVRIETLIVDPGGVVPDDRIDTLWFACPLGPSLPLFSCISAHFPLDPTEVRDCPDADDGDSSEVFAPCRLSSEREPTFTIPSSFAQPDRRGFSVELTLVVAEPNRTIERCIESLLAGDYDTPAGCQYATGRIPIAPPTGDPRVSEFDVNTHPRIDGITARVLSADGELIREQTVAANEELVIKRQQQLELAIESPPEDAQAYLIPINNGSSFQEATESVTAQWLRSDGELEGGDAGPPSLGDGQTAKWRPGEEQAVNIYALLRDDRAGIDWTAVSVRLDDGS